MLFSIPTLPKIESLSGKSLNTKTSEKHLLQSKRNSTLARPNYHFANAKSFILKRQLRQSVLLKKHYKLHPGQDVKLRFLAVASQPDDELTEPLH